MLSLTLVRSFFLASLAFAVDFNATSTLLAAPPVAPARLTLDDLLSAEPVGETPLSPDGKTFAFVHNGQIVLLPAEGGWPTTLTSSSGGKSGLSWSPDGSALSFVSQGSISVSGNIK